MKKYLFNNQWLSLTELHSLSKSLTQPTSLSIWNSYTTEKSGLSVSANEEDGFTETMYAVPSENIGYSTLDHIHDLGMSLSEQFSTLIANNVDDTDTKIISMVAFTDEFESAVFRTDTDTHFKTYNELVALGYHPVLPEITKVTDYLYEATYTEFDYNKAYAYANYYLEQYSSKFGAACTGVQFGNFRGRNFDWYYDNNAEFIVKVPAIANARHASIGISALTRGLTKDFVESGEFHTSYYILPFYMTDGINDAGLCISINIVTVDDKYQHEHPTGEHLGIIDGRYSRDQVTLNHYSFTETGRTTGTNPSAPITMPAMFVPRYLLDNAGTIEEAIDILTKQLNIVRVSSKLDPENAQEIHFLITAKDKDGDDKTIIVETINNKLIILTDHLAQYYDLDAQELTYFSGPGYNEGYIGQLIGNTPIESYRPAIMTNHYLATSSLTLYGAGMERDAIVANGLIDLISSKSLDEMTYSDMQSIMESVFYTKAYTNLDTSNPWLSEFHHDYTPAVYGDLNILSTKSDFDTLIPVLKTMYQNRDRDTANTWHTVHSCVYDLAQRMMYVKVQESSSVYYLGIDDLEIREIKSLPNVINKILYLNSDKSDYTFNTDITKFVYDNNGELIPSSELSSMLRCRLSAYFKLDNSYLGILNDETDSNIPDFEQSSIRVHISSNTTLNRVILGACNSSDAYFGYLYKLDSGNKYKAFWCLNGDIKYWYPLDGLNTDWISESDLASLNWSINQRLIFYLSSSKSVQTIDFMRTVSSSSSTKNEEWLLKNIDVGFSVKGIARTYYLYDDSGNMIIYDNTKKYTVVSINSETSRITPSGYSESCGIAYIMGGGNSADAYSIDIYDGYVVLKPYYVGYFGYANPSTLKRVSLSISIENIES